LTGASVLGRDREWPSTAIPESTTEESTVVSGNYEVGLDNEFFLSRKAVEKILEIFHSKVPRIR
jgi:hypothetical protein